MNKKVAIVTGGRRGIGLGIAKELGKEQYYVIISAASEDASAAIEELSNEGICCEYIQCNISDSQLRRQLISKVCERFGRIDLLVNNAGVAPVVRMDILETTEESYDRVMNINAKSTFFMCQEVANRMIEFKNKDEIEDYMPRIINISSLSSYASSTSRGEYCTSKAAISMTTLLFADRLAEYGIPVFEVRPGIILTDMTGGVKDMYKKKIENEGITPIKRFGTPKDVADCVVALCSGRLDFATGQVLNADGGFHIRRL